MGVQGQGAPFRDRVRDLVLRHGWNSTCYQTVNPIFEYTFFPEFDGVVAFVRARNRRVVAGAPICPASDLEAIIQRFDAAEPSCALYFGAGERVNHALTANPSSGIVSLGAQPVWNPSHWNELVLSRPSLRYQFRRPIRKGVTVREWSTDEAENSLPLKAVLSDWLENRGLPPLHFLVEPETLDYLKDRRTFVAELSGEPIAFLNLCPVPQQKGWLTEQFPRRTGSPNGTIDLLMHVAAQTVAAEGAEYLTMGLVPFSRYGEIQRNPRWLQSVMQLTRRMGSRLYSFKGLDDFKSKFLPERWEPVYAAVSGRSFRLGDLLAVTQAFTREPLVRTTHKVARKLLK